MKIKIVFFATMFFLALFPFASEAQFKLDKYKQTVNISATNVIIAGTLNGKSYYDAKDEIILVPKIKPGIGFGVEYGLVVGENGGTLDFAYRYSTSDYTTMEVDISGKTTTHVWQILGGKIYFGKYAEKRIKPYCHMDFTMTFNRFEHIAYDKGMRGELRSARYTGVAFGCGPGIQCMLTQNLALDLRVVPEFHTVAGVKSNGEKGEGVDENANLMLVNTFGLKYYFHKR